MKTKTEKSKLVYLWALCPILGAALLFLFMAVDTEIGIFIRPIFEFSVLGAVLVLSGFFLTGFSGFRFARNGVGALKAILVGNVIPIVCTLVYSVFAIIGGEAAESMLFLGVFGNGLFAVVSLYITVLARFTNSIFEVYISFGLLILSFVVGYSVGAIKNNK